MSTHIHRDGPHQITVEDDRGNTIRFVTVDDCQHGHRLQIVHSSRADPQLTPDDVAQLAAELDQWANTQYTRPHRPPSRQ